MLYFPCSEDSDNEEAEEDMNVDESKENEDDEVAVALAAANALGKATKDVSPETDNITNGLKELKMENYDDEEDGNSITLLADMFTWVEYCFFPFIIIYSVTDEALGHRVHLNPLFSTQSINIWIKIH